MIHRTAGDLSKWCLDRPAFRIVKTLKKCRPKKVYLSHADYWRRIINNKYLKKKFHHDLDPPVDPASSHTEHVQYFHIRAALYTAAEKVQDTPLLQCACEKRSGYIDVLHLQMILKVIF